jgi:glycerophosphoryl diester phosphodiesterase
MLILAVVAALALKLYISTQVPPLFMRLPRLEIAHRGFSSAAPENTVAAFKTALERQVVAVEVDLMLSKDGVVVVAHDYELDTFTDSTGLISEQNWDQLRDVQVTRGGKANSQYVKLGVDDRLARFEDILDAAHRGQIQLVIELKTVTNSSHLIKKVAELLIEYNYVGNTMVTSFFPSMLVEFHRHCPQAYTLLLYSHAAFRKFCNNSPADLRSSLLFSIACSSPELFDNIASYLVEPIAKLIGAGAIGIDVENPHVSDLASRALGWGLKVVVWTVNSINQRELVASIPGNQYGTIGIMSDCPHSFCSAEH